MAQLFQEPGTKKDIWNYGVIEEDASGGIHNPNYVNALIEASLEALK